MAIKHWHTFQSMGHSHIVTGMRQHPEFEEREVNQMDCYDLVNNTIVLATKIIELVIAVVVLEKNLRK